MVLIFIGLIVILFSVFVIRQNAQYAKWARGVEILGLIIGLIGFSTACVKEIDAGEVGVMTLFGKVDKDILESGLHVVNPLVKITRFDKRTQNYTMSAVHEEGDLSGDDAIRVLSADGLEVVIDLTVLYRVIPAESPKILREIGTDYNYKIVRPITRTKIRDNAVYYDAVQLYGIRRDEFQARITKSIEQEFKSRGLFLESLLVRNIALPQSVKATIESKINAEQESQKMQFVLTKEKQEADRKRVEAQGIADYQRIISAQLTDKQLQYEMIKAQQHIATSPNTKVIILGGKGNTPVLLTDK